MVKEQRVDACVENPKVTRERSRVSALAFRAVGFEGGAVGRCCACLNHGHQWAPPESSAIPMVGHAARGGGGRSRPSSRFGGAGTPFQASVSQNVPARRHSKLGVASMAPLSAARVANSRREKEVTPVAPPGEAWRPHCWWVAEDVLVARGRGPN